MEDKEFSHFIENFNRELKSSDNLPDTLHIIHKAIKEIVPCDSICILSIDKINHTVSTMEEIDKASIEYSLNKEGILSQCYESRQPLLVNDIHRSLLYNKEIDSLNKENIYKILAVPILNDDSSKDVLGIIWIGIGKGFEQFIQKDVDNLVYFTNAVKHQFSFINIPSSESEDDALTVCQESKKVLQIKIERNENYFASTIHDIRTPMNAVIGFMELMMRNETDEQKKEYIDATLKSGEHIVALINDALDMSKVSNGKMSLDKTTFSPIDGLSDIAKLFYNSMRKESINFNIYIDPQLPALIKSDLHRIKQIVNNLLSNAMKFTPVDGEVILEAIYNKEADTLKISVSDTGIGIAKEKQKSIFSPYAQETDATAKEYGGTGLGLAISQQLSILLNGTLTVESEQGSGSTFTFTFPCDTPQDTKLQIDTKSLKEISIVIFTPGIIHKSLLLIQRYLNDLNISYRLLDSNQALNITDDQTVLVAEREDAMIHMSKIQDFLDTSGHVLFIENHFGSDSCNFKGNFKLLHNPIFPHTLSNALYLLINPKQKEIVTNNALNNYEILKGHTVLVIDDSILNLKLMREILKGYQLDIVTCINAKEAFEILEDRTFDIIFIDQNMPIMNGDEAISLIRENEEKKRLKPSIIYGLTGDANTEIIERIIRSGANSVFTKPIHIEEVYEAISQGIEELSIDRK